MRALFLLLIALGCLCSPSREVWAAEAAGGGPPITIRVLELAKAPVVDGDLADWPPFDHPIWHTLPMQPALPNDPKNLTGRPEVRLAVALSGEHIHVAARFPDPAADVDFKPWVWRQGKYEQEARLDDMFAIRFQLDGRYDRCMFPEGSNTYQVDVWQWSAGRSNLASLAEDMVHTISTQFMEDAAEYPQPDNRTIYIKKRRDEGTPFYKLNRPELKTLQGERLPGVLLTGGGSGSLVDVAAVGKWADGYWSLEFSRKRVTGHSDDVAFLPGRVIPGGIAVFNKGNAEHKSVEGNLLFDLSAIKP
ncbi:MAG: ethylbenzene dehydrogenase-related protein [Magnetococcus sp. YQC-3]